ncbi:hypothetical protein CK203_058859 [Vitis vinifera]|uniref:RNase H type-1 domain-containing protein n=1 Tax=Vitis vinifera TaxID=29760 RepID=A0A438G8Q8_VITVI|nr:hypothetical protein CK203_058859 [Vitis vinifera]
MGNQRRSIPLPFTKGAETCLLCQQGIGRCRNQVFKNGANSLSSSKCCPKAPPLFSSHPVIVLTDQPLRSILHKPDLTGRMLQWAIELSEFGIEFQPRLSKKGQVMADFVLEYSRRPNQHHESSEQEWWTLRVDGASRSSGSGVGLLQSPTGEHLEQAIRLGFSASNNEAEYEAILSGLDLALALSVSKLRIYSDSQLVVRHVQKEYEAKDSRMARYLAKVRSTLQQFTEWTIEKIKRADNRHADALAGIAASLPSRSHSIAHTCASQSLCTLPEDPKQAHKIRVQAARFTLIGGHLYKRSFTGPYLRCLGHSEAQYVLAELHEGICGNHTGGRSLAHRAHSQGYYWPTMKKDAAAYVQKCDKCQRYAPIPHMPSAALKSVSGPWPFAHKWVEAEAYASIKDKDVTKFHCIQEFLFGIEYPEFILHATLSSKQWQAEATNKTLINALKKRLSKPKGSGWRSYPASCGPIEPHPDDQQETPFALTYGMDAVIPTEIGLPTIRTDAAKQKDANTELGRNLDWADEVRESAIRMADYQQSISALQSKSQAQKLQKWYAST